MKKLMVFGALALCAAVGYSDIESSNIVGYQEKGVRRLLSQQVCTFETVGGGGMDIQKLVPVDENGDYIGDGDITIQFTSDRGALENAYAYYGDDEYDDDCPAGWYNEFTDERVDFTFDPGQGFQVNAGSACTFVYAGEVVTAQTFVPCRRLLSPQGNVRPTAVDLQTIIPVDAADADGEYVGDGDITIQFCGDRGALESAYAYYGDDEYDDDCPAGWYNEFTDERVTCTLDPGQGFKVNAGTACWLKYPAIGE